MSAVEPHAAEAKRLLGQLLPTYSNAAAQREAAQVHATLAVAEQLRVANLIALASVEGLDLSKPWSAGYYESLRLDIMTALGIGAVR